MKRNKATNKLFAMDKLTPKNLIEIREYIVELEKRLLIARLVGSIGK